MDFPPNYLENKVKQKAPPTYLHNIVKEVCEYLYENPKDSGCWALWLGIGRRIGAGQLKIKLDYIKERGIKSSRYLLVMCKK